MLARSRTVLPSAFRCSERVAARRRKWCFHIPRATLAVQKAALPAGRQWVSETPVRQLAPSQYTLSTLPVTASTSNSSLVCAGESGDRINDVLPKTNRSVIESQLKPQPKP